VRASSSTIFAEPLTSFRSTLTTQSDASNTDHALSVSATTSSTTSRFSDHVRRYKELMKQNRKASDYPAMRFFHREAWKKFTQDNIEFKRSADKGKWMSYVELYDGSTVDQVTRKQLRHTYRKAFDHLHKVGETKSIWTSLDPSAEAYVLVEVIETHPYLASSAGLWKATTLASKLYGEYTLQNGLTDPSRARPSTSDRASKKPKVEHHNDGVSTCILCVYSR
jgi:hypothetical protein